MNLYFTDLKMVRDPSFGNFKSAIFVIASLDPTTNFLDALVEILSRSVTQVASDLPIFD